MTILDIFKKKKKKIKEKKIEKKKKVEKRKVKVTEKSSEEFAGPKIKEQARKEIKEPIKEKKIVAGRAWRILKSPHVTEKSTDLVKQNQYIFKVWPRTNKIEIKKAVEDLYEVNVVGVRVIKVPSKRRRLGKIVGERKGYKKAIVKLKKGQKIEVLPR